MLAVDPMDRMSICKSIINFEATYRLLSDWGLFWSISFSVCRYSKVAIEFPKLVVEFGDQVELQCNNLVKCVVLIINYLYS